MGESAVRAPYSDEAVLACVEDVLEVIEVSEPDLPEEERERFVLEVLLNALRGRLETVRERSPEDFDAFRAAAVAELRED